MENTPNSVTFQIRQQLSKMMAQTDFLVRNNKLLSRLDIDTMMCNTRELYDLLCSIQANMDVSSIPMEIETNEPTEKQADNLTENPQSLKTPHACDDLPKEITKENLNFEAEKAEPEECNEAVCDETLDLFKDQDIVENEPENVVVEEKYEEPQQVVHVLDIDESDLDEETISDKFERQEDNSVAAKFQRKPLNDLKDAIGINDKFLFLNELFKGSMEKYNKSMNALNDFVTLFGAKTYMSELQIELQWNTDSVAYQKLNELVERKFGK